MSEDAVPFAGEVQTQEQTINRIPALPGAVMMVGGILGLRWSMARILTNLGILTKVAGETNSKEAGLGLGVTTTGNSGKVPGQVDATGQLGGP